MNKLSFAIIAVSFYGSIAFSGAESGGGGGAVVCRNPITHTVISAELYDLYEGEVGSHLVIQHTSKLSPNDQITNALTQLNAYPWLKTIVLRTAQDIISRFKYLPKGVALAPPEDLGTGLVKPPVGCAIEGAGFYNEDDKWSGSNWNDDHGTVQVSRDVYNAFSNTDKAAFILHEGLYKFDRLDHGATTSKFARKLTAVIFATDSHFDFDLIQSTWGTPDFTRNYSAADYPQPFTWTSAVPKNNNLLPVKMAVSFKTNVKDEVMFGEDCFDVYGRDIDNTDLLDPGAGASGNGKWVTVSDEIPHLDPIVPVIRVPCDILLTSSTSEYSLQGDPRQFVLTSGNTKIYEQSVPLSSPEFDFLLGISHANITLPKIPDGT